MARSKAGLVLGLALLLVLTVMGSNGFGEVQSMAAGVELAPSAREVGERIPLQPCYTIDTSRPEWLAEAAYVYLPVVLKEFGP